MTTAYDIPAENLIGEIKEKLENEDKIQPPGWSHFVKTGVHKELPPVSNDWWFIRGASILRSLYMNGPIGVERLSSIYGGKKNRGSKPHRKMKGSGSIIRNLVQQLEKIGYIESTKDGRVISSSGRSMIDNLSFKLKNELLNKYPELKKY